MCVVNHTPQQLTYKECHKLITNEVKLQISIIQNITSVMLELIVRVQSFRAEFFKKNEWLQ